MKLVLISSTAEEELLQAAQWYAQQRAGLDDEFLEAAEEAVRRIGERPAMWPKVTRLSRRFRVDRFPYGVVYQEFSDHVLVHTVMHLSRHPRYWRHREVR